MRRYFVGLAVAVSALGFAVPPAHAFAPNVHVTPRTGLTDGQNVIVTGAGWPRNSNVWVRECSAGVWSGDQAACGTPVLGGMNGSTNHQFRFHFLITTGAVGNGSCGLGAGTGTQRSCAIEAVLLDSDAQPTSTYALRRIAFAATP